MQINGQLMNLFAVQRCKIFIRCGKCKCLFF